MDFAKWFRSIAVLLAVLCKEGRGDVVGKARYKTGHVSEVARKKYATVLVITLKICYWLQGYSSAIFRLRCQIVRMDRGESTGGAR